MRLIDADELAKEIADSINDASIQNDKLSLSILRVFKETVDDAPTIDAEEDYQRGLNDAWEAAGKIAGSIPLGGLNTHELMDLFGTSLVTEIVYMVTADQAIEKLRTYEAEKKAEEEIKVGDEAEEEIKVGDEVETDYTGNVIIAEKPKDGWYVTIAKNFARYSIHESHIIRKTGRHFPQVAELLDAMKEDGDT